jgi:hypothetical protein
VQHRSKERNKNRNKNLENIGVINETNMILIWTSCTDFELHHSALGHSRKGLFKVTLNSFISEQERAAKAFQK